MSAEERKTAEYKIIRTPEGNRYRFYCGISKMAVFTTKPFKFEDPEEELEAAWKSEGENHMNHCEKCGKWVCNAMYNPDVLQCVDCTPWEEKPNYCSHCGKKISPSAEFCNACGAKLRYREVAVCRH